MGCAAASPKTSAGVVHSKQTDAPEPNRRRRAKKWVSASRPPSTGRKAPSSNSRTASAARREANRTFSESIAEMNPMQAAAIDFPSEVDGEQSAGGALYRGLVSEHGSATAGLDTKSSEPMLLDGQSDVVLDQLAEERGHSTALEVEEPPEGGLWWRAYLDPSFDCDNGSAVRNEGSGTKDCSARFGSDPNLDDIVCRWRRAVLQESLSES